MWPIARSLTVCGLCFALPTASDRSRESGDKGVEKEWDGGQSGQAGGCMPLTASEINARTHTHTVAAQPVATQMATAVAALAGKDTATRSSNTVSGGNSGKNFNQ